MGFCVLGVCMMRFPAPQVCYMHKRTQKMTKILINRNHTNAADKSHADPRLLSAGSVWAFHPLLVKTRSLGGIGLLSWEIVGLWKA